MNEAEECIAECINTWVYGGFCAQREANEYLNDILEEDVDEAKMRQLIGIRFAEKAVEEAGWPAVTDCDRLDAAFADLDNSGIISLQNAGYTMSDGLGDIWEAFSRSGNGMPNGYCFYHEQDLERAVNGEGLTLAFGDMEDTPAGKAEVARMILSTLRDHGINADWDGDPDRRIDIPCITWHRRYKPSR